MYYLERNKLYTDIKKDIDIIYEIIKKLKLEQTLKNSKIDKLILDIDKELKIILKSLEELKNPFLLFVMGSGKYGKSTLINALIKEKILKTRDIPNTWKLDILIGSDKERVEIEFEDEVKFFVYKDGILFLECEEKNIKNSKKEIKNKIRNVKKEKNISIYDLKQYKRELENKYLYKSKVKEVKYYIKKVGILKDFIIVDTPGLNQSLLKNTTERMNNYYKRADGVIWVLDAKNIVSKSNLDMIDELNKNCIKSINKNIICVVNKIDEIHNEKDLKKIKDKVKNLYSNYFLDIIFLSSKQAIDGYESKNYELVNLSKIDYLINSIDKNFKKNSEQTQINSKYSLLKIISKKLLNLINTYKRNLYEDLYKYDEIKKNINIEIEKIKNIFISKVNLYLSIENLLRDGVYNQLKNLQELVEVEANNMYFNINKEIDESEDKILKLKSINISKISMVIEIEKIINNLNEKKSLLYTLKNKNDKNIYLILRKRDELKSYVFERIDYNLNILKNDLNYKLDCKFEKMYINYNYTKEHLNQINNIINVLGKWGDNLE